MTILRTEDPFNVERDLVYMVVESLGRRELRSLLSSNNMLYGAEIEIDSLVKSLFDARHFVNWAGITVPNHVIQQFSSPTHLWWAMQNAALSGLLQGPPGVERKPIEKFSVRELLSENLTNSTIEELIEEYLEAPLGVTFEADRVRAHMAGLILGYEQLKNLLFEREIPRVQAEFESLTEGISNCFSILPGFLLLRPGEMADRKGYSIALKNVAPTVYIFTLTSRFFTPKGAFIQYQAVHNVPNQLAQHYILQLSKLSAEDLTRVYKSNLIDNLFGEGATSDLLTKSPENMVSWNQQRFAGDTLAGNILFSSIYSLRYVAKHYVMTNNPEVIAQPPVL